MDIPTAKNIQRCHNVACKDCSHCTFVHEYELYFCDVRERLIQAKYMNLIHNCDFYNEYKEETK